MFVVGFTSKSSSKLIQWLAPYITGSKWIHTWVEYISPSWGGRWVAHASSKGVVIVPATRYLRSIRGKGEIVRYKVKNLDTAAGMSKCRLLIGRDYDYKSLVWNLFLVLLYKWFGRLLGTPRIDRTKITCSEFVSSILKEAGAWGEQNIEPEFLSPGALESLCHGSPDFEVLESSDDGKK